MAGQGRFTPPGFLFQTLASCRVAMGQAESHRRAGTAPQNSHGVRSRGGLALLPEELLVLILSWVPGRILATRGRLVCRHWRDLIDSPLPWKLQAERDPSKQEGLRSALKAARRCPRLEWARVGALQPFARNLIKNPRGEDQFLHWQVGHGDGWCLGDNTCWMLQLVDLVKEGLWEDLLDTCQPDIFISEWWGTHENCGCTYNLYITLLAGDKTSVIARFVTEADSAEEWDIPFQQASHVFREYGPGVRYLRFQHIGSRPGEQRTEAHLTNSTVLVKLSG